MDDIQDHLTTLYKLASPHLSSLTKLYTYARATQLFLTVHILPHLAALTANPSIASVVLLLVLLFISLKLLNLLYQTVLWWFRLFFRLVFWVTVVALVMWVVTRGPEGAVSDLGKVGEAWKGEYEFWQARAQGETLGRTAAAGRTGGYWSRGTPGYPGAPVRGYETRGRRGKW